MNMRTCSALLIFAAAMTASAAEKLSLPELIRLSRSKSAQFREALVASLGDAQIRKGAAVLGEGPDFIWAVESEKTPILYVDRGEAGPMTRLEGNLWYHTGQLPTGTSHAFYYMIAGERFGGSFDVPAFGPDSYEHPGVPRGKLSDKMVHTSKIYDGMQSEYWVYTPAGYDPAKPAALMVWQDGHGPADREHSRAQIVFDNLTYQKKIPPAVYVFIDPGKIGARAMRSVEYDTMNDSYARFLRDEILPEVSQKYNIRKDAYSRAIAGSSSGGICAFNVAWRQPDLFSRVQSWIGSFTSIQWHMGEIDGGNVFPFLIRKSPKRNIRVWLQDGSEDLENNHGAWPLQNIQMANSLKMMGYDFHLSFGPGTHNGAQGNAELPQSMTWLWRDYDPSRTEQIYEMESAEKSKPLFRVTIYNRDH
jgi:enterochelin esterase-like enzyme